MHGVQIHNLHRESRAPGPKRIGEGRVGCMVTHRRSLGLRVCPDLRKHLWLCEGREVAASRRGGVLDGEAKSRALIAPE